MFRSRILPALIVLWGAAIVVNFLIGDRGDGGYGAGQIIAFVVGLLMVFLGIRALIAERRT